MIDFVQAAALAPVLALLGAVINGLFGRWTKEPGAGVLATIAVGAGFVLALGAFFALLGGADPASVTLWPYLQAGGFELSIGYRVDQLSVLMMLIITGVGTLIHLYSIGYMHGDDGFSRYFSALNLFVAAMLVLVLADSFLLMFVGWEGVGVCSYLLIGFWFRDRENADAARKAFIVNRIGDVGFLLAMFLMIVAFGTLDVAAVNEAAHALPFGAATVTAIGLLLLLAAAGKSAQLPLQVWLPDAMAGPTPVSALIHAATMVTAGVYLIARSAPLFAQTPAASAAVAWIGALTAIIAAFAAFAQTDIKKILAYSTIGQLGYMFVAVGVGAYWVAIFHVFTHAFFKALLFLGSGSVIHALDGEQDLRKMGGLRRHMPVTAATSLVATAAIAGVPLLAGFFSKDAILASTFNSELVAGYGASVLYAILLVTAGMTAFYMTRWYHRIFEGTPRLSEAAEAHVHESPGNMTVPLVVLAAFSALAGWVGIPEFLAKDAPFVHWMQHWLEPATLGTLAEVGFRHPALWIEWLLIGLSVAAAAVGIGVAWWLYAVRDGRAFAGVSDGPLAALSRGGGGFDAAYEAAIKPPVQGTADGIAVLDRGLVDRGLAAIVGALGQLGTLARRLQSGYVRAYALLMLIGVVAVIGFVALAAGIGGAS